jgi:hypothetical protein
MGTVGSGGADCDCPGCAGLPVLWGRIGDVRAKGDQPAGQEWQQQSDLKTEEKEILQTLGLLADALETGDTETALTYIEPSQQEDTASSLRIMATVFPYWQRRCGTPR